MNLHHDTREPEEIERDLDRTRERVSATIDAIQQRMTPGQLVDQAFNYLRHSAPADFGANLSHTVRHNPVPVTLIGVGIAWLMAQGRHGTVDEEAYAQARARAAADGWDATYGRPAGETGDADEAGGSRWRDAAASAGAMGHKVKDGAAHAREAAHHTRERWADGVRRARGRAGELGDRSRQQIDRARGAVSSILDEQPLVLGALGLALGAALGASLPATRREDELMGDRRDDLLDRAQRSAHDKADAVAHSVADSVRQTVHKSDEAREQTADERRGDYPTRPLMDDGGAFPAGTSRRMDGLL